MKHVHASIAGAAGVVVGIVAGAGSATLLTQEAAPAIERPAPPTSATDLPDEPDQLVQWLKQHPRHR